MRYALIRNGVVENIIDYDPDAISLAQEEFTVRDAEYRRLVKQHQKDVQKYNERCVALQAKARRKLGELKKEEPDSRHSITVELPDAPIAPSPPRRPLGAYTPPKGTELIKADEHCAIGFFYRNGEFLP